MAIAFPESSRTYNGWARTVVCDPADHYAKVVRPVKLDARIDSFA